MTRTILPVAALLFLLNIPSHGADATIVAQVGDSEVKADDIKPLLETLPIRDQLTLAHDPAALNEFVRTLIVQQLVYKEALAKKWADQPQVVAQLERLRQQAITQSYIQSLATPPADFPSQAELQEAYDILKKNNALLVPRQYHLAQIYIAAKGTGASGDKTPEARLEVAQKALKAGDFAAVAKSLSEEAKSAQRGGDLGWLPEGQIQPEIKDQIAALAKGAVTEPVHLNDGYHIIKVLEVKEPYIASLDEVKNALTNELRKERAQALSKAYLAQLLKQNPVTLNEIEVSKLLDSATNKAN